MHFGELLLGSAPDLAAIGVLAYWLKHLLSRIERRLEAVEKEVHVDQVQDSGMLGSLNATIKGHTEKFKELDRRIARVEPGRGA